jgi:hypothetical protein
MNGMKNEAQPNAGYLRDDRVLFPTAYADKRTGALIVDSPPTPAQATGTIHLKLFKLAARAEVSVRRIRVLMAESAPEPAPGRLDSV